MERKLASIQRIVSIDPIPGADKIEKATVLGWEVVVGKNDNFKAGDFVIYVETDSIMPEKPEYEFLRERKFRVRTIKLKKQVSQGLVLPLKLLGPGDFEEGQDVSKLLGVRKYDPQADLEQAILDETLKNKSNKVNKFLSRFPWYRRLFSFFMPKKASWPKFIKKTDEDRIQLFPNICEQEKDTLFQTSEKLDGQSGTYGLVRNKNHFLWFGKKYIFLVCSRNLYLPKPDNSSYWTIAKKYDVESVLKSLIEDNEFVVLQGEILGPGIQKNKYGLKEYDFYAFNLIYPDRKVENVTAEDMLRDLGVKFVPLLTNSFKLKPTIPENVECAKGKSKLADVKREGIVVRSYEKNISFKIINPDFLLEHEE